MSSIWMKRITGPKAWRGEALAHDPSWLVTLTAAEIADIDRAVATAKASGRAMADVGREEFPLSTLRPRLEQTLAELTDGRGFVVLRGLPVERYSDDDVGLIFWGLGRYLGSPLHQNPQGDLLGHVYDHGRTYGNIDVRGYETSAYLPYHTDAGDMVGLLCLRRSLEGGLSSIVSSVTVHNEILKAHPEHLGLLYNGFYYIRREAALTDNPVTPHRLPVLGARDGLVSVRLVRNQIRAAGTKTGVPLEPIEMAALDLFDELAYDPDIHLDMDLQQGDIQFCNNYVILHSRTAFEDHPEIERRRHMVRLWLTMDRRRPLADGFPPHNGYGDRQLIEPAMQAKRRQ